VLSKKQLKINPSQLCYYLFLLFYNDSNQLFEKNGRCNLLKILISALLLLGLLTVNEDLFFLIKFLNKKYSLLAPPPQFILHQLLLNASM